MRISNESEYVRLWMPSSRHWVEVGQIVTLTYTDPNAGDAAKVIKSKGEFSPSWCTGIDSTDTVSGTTTSGGALVPVFPSFVQGLRSAPC